MPDRIKVTVAPTTFALAPGESAEAVATLQNLGQTVDQLSVALEGLEPAWYTLPVSSVALFPNDQDKLRVTLSPPRSQQTRAGTYPFRLRVASQENPQDQAVVELKLEVRALLALDFNLSPHRVVGRTGQYQVTVKNPGETEAAVHLKATDPEGKLRLTVRPETMRVPAHGQSQAEVVARAGWLAAILGDEETDFDVLATQPGVEEGKTLSAQLEVPPWYRSLSRIRLPFISRPASIVSFTASTEDEREFSLSWAAKRATRVTLGEDTVEARGEKMVRPAEPAKYVLTATNRYGTATQTVDVRPRPVPKAKLSEKIRASLTPIDAQVRAGGPPMVTSLKVQNLGDIVDKFTVEVEGLDETWYSRSASSLALMPQATDQVQVTFQPPKKKGVKAGTYPFAVAIRSQATPEMSASVVGQLEILPQPELKLTVHPFRVTTRRKATYRISLANTGVSDVTASLQATDLEEGLEFRFQNENPVARAWQTVEVPVVAQPKRGKAVGEKKRYDITITANAGGGITQTVNCELHHNPRMTSWRPILRVVRAVVVLGALAVAMYFVLQLGGGWSELSRSPQGWVATLVKTIEKWFFR